MKIRAPRNRTLTVNEDAQKRLEKRLTTEIPPNELKKAPLGQIIQGDALVWAKLLPKDCVDLLILDPPYNLTKKFGTKQFRRINESVYTKWLDGIVATLKPLLKLTATVYVCGDWRTSHSIFEVLAKHFTVHNRITWEREKGRGAKFNWKNSSEDIWFCTMSNDYFFDVDSVKMRRRVIAPYRDEQGKPKDWLESNNGNFRDTHPSNIWTDITIPFWSMPENTDHPTQKSEKLLAKLLLASSRPGDLVLDPFLGSGTTAVVASKLGREFIGIELEKEYCLLALNRLEMAKNNSAIQGYIDSVFWERNSAPQPNPSISRQSRMFS